MNNEQGKKLEKSLGKMIQLTPEFRFLKARTVLLLKISLEVTQLTTIMHIVDYLQRISAAISFLLLSKKSLANFNSKGAFVVLFNYNLVDS